MNLKQLLILLVITLSVLSACSNQTQTGNIVAAEISDQNLQPAIGGFMDEHEQFLMDLRKTLNLSFKIFEAMNKYDYDFLEASIATGVTINREHNQVEYQYSGKTINYDFITGIHLSNLEYWGSGYTDDHNKFHVIFARYFDETHGTIYFDFIKEDNEWLLSGISTNA